MQCVHAGDKTAWLKARAWQRNVCGDDGQTFLALRGSDDAKVQLEAKAAVTPKDGDEAKAKLKDGRVLT